MARRTLEFAQGVRHVDGSRALLLRKLFPAVVQNERQVHVAGRPSAERFRQHDLPRRVVEKVRPAHDVRHARGDVVRHHGELIGPKAVGASFLEHAHPYTNPEATSRASASSYASYRSCCQRTGSSETRPKPSNAARIARSAPGMSRGGSMSSMRTSHVPSCTRASSQLGHDGSGEKGSVCKRIGPLKMGIICTFSRGPLLNSTF